MSINTPALLFPAITLLLLAYTNRFLAIATLIRQLHQKYQSKDVKSSIIKGQIVNLKTRLNLIKFMQLFAILSFFLCVLSMSFIFSENDHPGSIAFGASLAFLLISLGLSLRETQISTKALNLELEDME